MQLCARADFDNRTAAFLVQIGSFAYCDVTDVKSHLIFDVKGDQRRTSGRTT